MALPGCTATASKASVPSSSHAPCNRADTWTAVRAPAAISAGQASGRGAAATRKALRARTHAP